MMMSQEISQYQVGKYNIDITKLSNEDKVKFVRIENMLKDLIDYYVKSRKLMAESEEGHEIREADKNAKELE